MKPRHVVSKVYRTRSHALQDWSCLQGEPPTRLQGAKPMRLRMEAEYLLKTIQPGMFYSVPLPGADGLPGENNKFAFQIVDHVSKLKKFVNTYDSEAVTDPIKNHI